jgi:predicted unusual protein kinase regulating ubiquinone biosynthesis (AarF/ABC1/UbiB family)
MSRAGERFAAGARATARRLAAKLRDVLLRDPGSGDTAERAGAEEIARSAADLKGGMAKVAQLMAYLEGPGAAVDAGARAALGALWDQAPGADPAAIRAVVQADLGDRAAELLAAWEDTPMAAASLGEVHGARAADGTALAVKVQYPGVADALRSDLDSRAVLTRLAGVEAGGAHSAETLAAVREAVLRELDVAAERKAMDRFAARFHDDPGIVVPRSFAALSSPRVLTAERLAGAPILTWAAAAPADARARAALILLRFAYASPLCFGLLNADPNPGNYLVLDDSGAKIGFLDYGCHVELDEATLAAERKLWQALVGGEGEGFRHALHEEGLVESARVFVRPTYREWERHVAAPFLHDSFTWTIAYARELAQLTAELIHARALRLPPAAVLLWRARLGIASVLGSLAPTADFRTELIHIVRRAVRM